MNDDNQQKPQEDAAPDETAGPTAAEAVDLAARVAELEAEAAKMKDQALRAMAETENVRRRLEQQAEDRGKYAIANFAKDVVQVADNLRRALDAVPTEARESEMVANLTVGVEMTERELLTALERYGVKPVPGLGSRFDPNHHQAMMEIEDASKPHGTVALVMQQGYMIHDRLLRPAMVGVSKGGPKAGQTDQQRVDTQA